MSISPDKEKAVEAAVIQIERRFGKGSIMQLGSKAVIGVPVIPTGSLALDKALGIGGLPRGRVVKNKLAPPFKEAEFDMMYDEGISQTGELIDLGVEEGIIDKSGPWYSFEGERIGQGRDNVKDFLKTNPDICNAVSAKLKEVLGFSGEKKESA